MPVSVAVGLVGIALAYMFYVLQARAGRFRCRTPSAASTRWSYNKYFVDEIYDATVVEPVVHGSRTVLWNGVDAGLIDGTVNGVGSRSRGMGGILRLMQSGNIRSYAAWVVLGSVVARCLRSGSAGGVR